MSFTHAVIRTGRPGRVPAGLTTVAGLGVPATAPRPEAW